MIIIIMIVVILLIGTCMPSKKRKSASSDAAWNPAPKATGTLHSAKAGAVETGCSELYDVMYYFTI